MPRRIARSAPGSWRRDARIGPAELAGIFLVGGASRMPLVASKLHAWLGVAPAVPEQPELPVAFGALLAADLPAPPPPSGDSWPPVPPKGSTTTLDVGAARPRGARPTAARSSRGRVLALILILISLLAGAPVARCASQDRADDATAGSWRSSSPAGATPPRPAPGDGGRCRYRWAPTPVVHCIGDRAEDNARTGSLFRTGA